MRLAVVLASLLLGCTAPNPNYAGDNGGAGSSGGVGGGGSADLASTGPADFGAPDLSTPAECAGDQRRCVTGPVASQSCSGGHFIPSRQCPEGDVSVLDAQCTSGYCQPPVGAAPCDINGGPSEGYCFNQVSSQHSCQPFLDPQSKAVSWACAIVVGTGASGDACTDGSQCRSGFCGSNGTCFRPCSPNGNGNGSGSSDCPQHNPPLTCKKVQITVEGVKINPLSCAP